MRAIRTEDYLYIYNFAPDHWPMGTPDYANSCGSEDRWIANADNGPTKKFMYANRDRDDVTANDDGDSIKDLYDLAVAKRPQEELYDLGSDPHQMNNIADDSAYDSVRQNLHDRLFAELTDTADPRVVGTDPVFDYSYSGGYVTYPGDSEISKYEL